MTQRFRSFGSIFPRGFAWSLASVLLRSSSLFHLTGDGVKCLLVLFLLSQVLIKLNDISWETVKHGSLTVCDDDVFLCKEAVEAWLMKSSVSL